MRLLPLGDSITKGPPSFPGGYRGVLLPMLIAAGWDCVFVGSSRLHSDGLVQPDHEGHSGFTLRMLREGARNELTESTPLIATLQRHRPDLVLLLAGTNDIYFSAPDVAAAEHAKLVEVILRYHPTPALFVGTLLPILPGQKHWGDLIPDDVGVRLARYNELLGAAAASRRASGLDVTLVDLSPCGGAPGTHLADGVHLTEAANRRVAAAWFVALEQWRAQRQR